MGGKKRLVIIIIARIGRAFSGNIRRQGHCPDTRQNRLHHGMFKVKLHGGSGPITRGNLRINITVEQNFVTGLDPMGRLQQAPPSDRP